MPRSRTTVVILVALFATVFAGYALRAIAIHEASANKTARVRGLPSTLSDPHFRIAMINDSFDHPHPEKVRVIAIERHTADTPHSSLKPSFCDTKVDNHRRTAMMYIEGRAITPSPSLVVFFAEYGSQPCQVVLDRSAFNEIYPLHDDRDLWGLCERTIAASRKASGE